LLAALLTDSQIRRSVFGKMARTPSPSTPRQRRLPRMESSEKLDDPSKARPRRAPMPRILGSPAVQDTRSQHTEVITSAADHLWTRHTGDEKYWAQIRNAQQLLFRSIGTELSLSEAASPNEVLEPLLRDAIQAQQADRLSATTMLGILNELVSRLDGEILEKRAGTASAPMTPPRNAGKRARNGSPASEDRDSADEMQVDTDAMAAMSLASPAAGGSKLTPPQTPRRKIAGLAAPAWPCTPDRPRRIPGFMMQTPEPVSRLGLFASPMVDKDSKEEEDLASRRKKLRPFAFPPFPGSGASASSGP